MKIISKYKDYYDYLQGIYGIDDKLILDRTEFTLTPERYHWENNIVVRFVICDWVVEGLWMDGKYYYGNEIEQFCDNPPNKWGEKDEYYQITQHSYKGFVSVLKVPTKQNEYFQYQHRRLKIGDMPIYESVNDKYNCPILFYSGVGDYSKFPILKDYDFHKVFTAFEMWTMLTDWLGREKVIVNNQTDKEKILSNGFDLKTSFRNPINKRK